MSSANFLTKGSRFQFHHPTTAARRAPNEQRGFTLTELLAVLAAVALLAMVALPAFAGARIKGARALCGENQRQMFVASLVYAESFSTKLPPFQDDNIPAGQYSRRVYGGAIGAAYYVARSFTQPPGSTFQNMGYLYGANLVGDGTIFYCPAVFSGALSAPAYSPLLTTDAGGSVRASYYYNPRVINWNSAAGTVNTHRRYTRTTQFEAHKVFSLDIINGVYAHSADLGYNVIFTDGSVKLCRVTSLLAAQLAQNVVGNDSDYASREQLYDLFEGM